MKFIYLLFLFLSPMALAAPNKSDTYFFAAASLGKDMADWIVELQPAAPTSLAVVDIRFEPPLNQDFGIMLETAFMERLKENSQIRALSCFQCRSARATVIGDQVSITRGIPNIEELKKIAQSMGVESYLILDTRRSATSTIVSAQLFSGAGPLIASRNFSEQTLDIDGGSAMFGLVATVGMGIGGKEKEEQDPSGAADVFLLQELGDGRKGGIVVGGFAGNGGGAGYALPTLGWTQRRSLFNLRGLTQIGVGPGFSTKGFGIAGRLAHHLYLGYCVFGLEAAGLIPVSSKSDKQAADLILGMSIGFVLGR